MLRPPECDGVYIIAGKHYIISIDPAVFEDDSVIPVVVLYSGMGGFTMGLEQPPDGTLEGERQTSARGGNCKRRR